MPDTNSPRAALPRSAPGRGALGVRSAREGRAAASASQSSKEKASSGQVVSIVRPMDDAAPAAKRYCHPECGSYQLVNVPLKLRCCLSRPARDTEPICKTSARLHMCAAHLPLVRCRCPKPAPVPEPDLTPLPPRAVPCQPDPNYHEESPQSVVDLDFQADEQQFEDGFF